MKNLKKLTRETLKSVKGNGRGSGIGSGACQEYLPMDPPMPGQPFDCSCNQLRFCPKYGTCIHMNDYTSEMCESEF
ncbi:hypothetical protein VUJ46_18300 [Chryseobacterium sp. MYb264]|uniref:bacteriocin-like protein n=1 Tax=Chryseobacterium sp. MYb264 TaxID=2745153 RepID=UPI002E1239D5|nr:hypothetical protein VUJ46_18300 [Chryseobacterium sp. MYb264]